MIIFLITTFTFPKSDTQLEYSHFITVKLTKDIIMSGPVPS